MTQPADHGKSLVLAVPARSDQEEHSEAPSSDSPPARQESPAAGQLLPSCPDDEQAIPAAAAQDSTSRTNPADPRTSADLEDTIRRSVGDTNYERWFRGRSRFERVDNQLVIHVPNPFLCSWMMKRFRPQLTTAAVTLLGLSAGFVIHVDSRQAKPAASPAAAVSAPDSEHSPRRRDTGTTSSDALPRTGPAHTTPRPVSQRRFRSFATFVSGPCNELALMAAQQICAAPGERFNPLYLHGATGVGKTHLLESIYTELRRSCPERNVLFLTSESFTNYFTAALAERSVPSFRQRFRSVDVLLIDNIEFLGNKKATQEEFLHTIDQVMGHGGQLVLTSDRHPRLLTRHREELTARFVEGLVCRIETPAEITRQRIVESFVLPYRNLLSAGAVRYLVRHGGRNARELRGSLNSLISYAGLHHERITQTRARELLGDLRDECRRLVRIDDVERVVCEAFGVSVEDMRSKTRRRAISGPRSIAMYVARRLTQAAWREIGQHFGGRDHSTVVAAARRVDQWIAQQTPVNVPTSCRGSTWEEVVREIEERLLAVAS